MFWDQRFLDPIMLPGRKPPLVTLRDAAQYITKLPKAEHDAEEWQAAMEALLLVAEHDGPPMFARIGIMRALNRGYVREFNSRARTRIGAYTAKARYAMTDPKKDACESTGNKRGPSKQSREAERQRVVEEYVMDLREIIKKLRKFFN
jgi:predicted secreted protein